MLNIFSLFFQKNKKFTRDFLKIFTLSFVIFLSCSVESTLAANLSISPSSVTTKVGKTFSIDLVVNNNIDAINAASALITFPQDTLSVVSVSKTGSFISLWAEEPAFSNEKGTVTLEGVALNPGFNKATGKIIIRQKIYSGNSSVDTKQLLPGIYHIRVESDKKEIIFFDTYTGVKKKILFN